MPLWRSLTLRFPRPRRRGRRERCSRVGIADTRVPARRPPCPAASSSAPPSPARWCSGAGVVLADEPIASLDPESARKVMDILAELNREDGVTVLVSLHQVEFAMRYCPRVIALRARRGGLRRPSRALTPAVLRRPLRRRGRRAALRDRSCSAVADAVRRLAAARGEANAAPRRLNNPFHRPTQRSYSNEQAFRNLIAAAAWRLLAAGLAAPCAQPKELNFGIISTDSVAEREALTGSRSSTTCRRRPGFKINAFFAPDYAGIIEAMRFNKVQVAWYGNKCGDGSGRSRRRRDLRPDGRCRRHRRATTRCCIVHKDSPINSLDDVLKNAQEHRLRQRRSEFHLGLPGAGLLRVRPEQDRSQEPFQGGALGQP